MVQRQPVQTAAILICLTGKRSNKLPLQMCTPRGGSDGREGEREEEKAKEKIMITGCMERHCKRMRERGRFKGVCFI